MDVPNIRKVHSTPIPRLGGSTFLPSMLLSISAVIVLRLAVNNSLDDILQPVLLQQFILWVAGAGLLYLLGLADDLVSISFKYKFVVQVVAATLLAFSGGWMRSLFGLAGISSLPIYIGIPFTIVLVVYITNAINLIDGIDGLAACLCALSLITMSILFVLEHEFLYALTSVVTLGVLLPFLYFNLFGTTRKHSKIFMGDTGSLTLGFVLSFLLMHNFQIHNAEGEMHLRAVIISVSPLLVPLLDVIQVFAQRVYSGQSPFAADKKHLHHKFMHIGCSAHQTLVIILLMALFFVLLNWALSYVLNINLILAIDILLWLAVQYFLYKRLHSKLQQRTR